MNKNTVKTFLILVAVLFFSANTTSAAAGDLFLDKGTVYYTNYLGQKRPFSNAEVFFAHGFNFSQVRAATDADLMLPTGAVMTLPEGTLVKAKNSATVYLIKSGQKRPFSSILSFTSRGYSFNHLVTTDSAQLALYPTGNTFSNVAGSTTEE
ncbi:MAG: hypothetical protein A2751_04670 [Candidatus Doudnabacteria bacterium RIFCSPHIGHO2_01_FULL_46_14]|uniref:Uncharacterized protein n=1 Tax=Candidatus Doudnabacteria bacterium RIFCSPHIGHO2_01_FULL_46_14 TaxID=1817824 RepID=A0A1F5NNJ3_9BACT|nr:MAG: hypothetical protein A2751_04670 [Candidatus Doudnabacteria bacterium RIFCSPHIGHO2_01_FULL_46_14]